MMTLEQNKTMYAAARGGASIDEAERLAKAGFTMTRREGRMLFVIRNGKHYRVSALEIDKFLKSVE